MLHVFCISLIVKVTLVNLQPINIASESRFWQITDIHTDLQYDVNGDPKHKCHLNRNDKNNDTKKLGEYGDYNCDPPIALLKLALDYTSKIDPHPDFILWSGDNGPHAPYNIDKDKLLETITKATNLIRQYYPNVTILPVVGNHDVSPTNKLPASPNDYFRRLSNIWTPLLDRQESKNTFKKGGYYSWISSQNSSLRVLILNTILWYNPNTMVTDESDPAGQFNWLEKELNDAKIASQKVLIVAHAPPGGSELLKGLFHLHQKYNAKFLEILRKNVDVLSAGIFGHEHVDSFRILLKNKKAYMPIFLAPSITPYYFKHFGSINPSIRKYRYDKSSAVILDYDQYHVSNLSQPEFQLEYSFLKEYSLKSLTAEVLQTLAGEFLHNVNLFKQHYLNLNARGPHDSRTIDSQFQCHYVCALTRLDTTSVPADPSVETLQHCQEGCPDPGDKKIRIDDGSRKAAGPDTASNNSTDSLPMIPILLGVLFGFSVLLVGIALIVNRDHMCKSRYRRTNDSPNTPASNSYTYSRI